MDFDHWNTDVTHLMLKNARLSHLYISQLVFWQDCLAEDFAQSLVYEGLSGSSHQIGCLDLAYDQNSILFCLIYFFSIY